MTREPVNPNAELGFDSTCDVRVLSRTEKRDALGKCALQLLGRECTLWRWGSGGETKRLLQ